MQKNEKYKKLLILAEHYNVFFIIKQQYLIFILLTILGFCEP